MSSNDTINSDIASMNKSIWKANSKLNWFGKLILTPFLCLTWLYVNFCGVMLLGVNNSFRIVFLKSKGE